MKNKCRLSTVFLVVILLCQSKINVLNAQSLYSKDVEDRIKKVENSLVSWAVTDADSAWSLDERIKYYGVKGISIAVINDFKIDWAKAYGLADEVEKKSVTTETLFQAASISKSFNTTGILKLYQENKIDLYKDINAYITSWKFPYDTKAGGKTINLYNILSHTGGLSSEGFDGYIKGKSLPTVVQMLDGKKPANIKPVRAICPPGLKFGYSGGGYLISQLLVVDVTKQSYEEYMRVNILKPLNMTNSSYVMPPTEEMQKVIATGYYENGKEVKGKYHIFPESAPGGLWTTPSDLCKYIIETQLSYVGKSSKILSQEFTQLRLKTVMADIEPNCDLIMGGFILKGKNEDYFFHAGGNDGYTAVYFGSLKTGKGLAIMCNRNGSIRILKEIANSIAKVYDWTDFPLMPIHKKVVNLPETLLSKYVGKYKFNGDVYKIKKQGSSLYAEFDGESFKLNFTSETEFYIIEQWHKDFKIIVDDAGKVTGQIVQK